MPKQEVSLNYRDFLLGGTATALACLFTNPIDVVKTRMQLQGELQSRSQSIASTSAATTKLNNTNNIQTSQAQALNNSSKVINNLKNPNTQMLQYRNPFQAFQLIFKNEGIRGLQRGLIPASLYQMVMNGTRLGTYSVLKQVFGIDDNVNSSIETTRKQDITNFFARAAAAASAGAFAATISSPLYMIRTRMHSFSGNAVSRVGTQHSYNGTFSALKEIYKSNGFIGLFRGAESAALRVSVGSTAQLTTYDNTKHFFQSRFNLINIQLHLASALCSGLVVTLCMNPFDVVVTRVYNQKFVNGKGLLYSGPFDAFIKIFKIEGFYGFYKGFWAHYLRQGPHTVLTFMFLEQLRALYDKIM